MIRQDRRRGHLVSGTFQSFRALFSIFGSLRSLLATFRQAFRNRPCL